MVSVSQNDRPEGVGELVDGHCAVLQIFTGLFEFLLCHLRFCHGLSFLCQQLVFQLWDLKWTFYTININLLAVCRFISICWFPFHLLIAVLFSMNISLSLTCYLLVLPVTLSSMDDWTRWILLPVSLALIGCLLTPLFWLCFVVA